MQLLNRKELFNEAPQSLNYWWINEVKSLRLLLCVIFLFYFLFIILLIYEVIFYFILCIIKHYAVKQCVVCQFHLFPLQLLALSIEMQRSTVAPIISLVSLQKKSGLPFQRCWTRFSHTAPSCCFGNKWREYRSITSRIHAACQCQNSASVSCPSKNLILVFQPCVALSWDITLIVSSQTAAKYPPNTWDNPYNQYFSAGLLNLGHILIVLF